MKYIERRIKEYLLPEKIVDCSPNVIGKERLIFNRFFQKVVENKEVCTVKGKGFIVLDFGREYYGGARISFNRNSYTGNTPYLRVRFGESLEECYAEIGEKNAGNDHSTRDLTVYMSSNSDMEWGNTGYRFIRIDFLLDEEYRLNNIFGTFIHGDEPIATFRSDDQRLDDIFSTAARTLFLCKQGYIWDGIKRDQLVWMGDMFPEVLGMLYLYGDCDDIRNSLDFITDSYAMPCWYNQIPSYNIWYMLTVNEYVKQTGNFVEKYAAAVKENLKLFLSCVKGEQLDILSAGLSLWADEFFDWPSFKSKDAGFAVRALLVYTVRKIISAKLFDDETLSLAEEISSRLKDIGDSCKNFKSIEALKILIGKDGSGESLKYVLSGGAEGYSTFLSYFISKALCENGYGKEAFLNNLEYYGGMLDMGATTFWESFDLKKSRGAARIDEFANGRKSVHGDFGEECYEGFRHSLCHGWSCGVIPYIVEEIIGFYHPDGDVNKVAFRPRLWGLKFAECKIPVKGGVISVRHKDVGGVIKTEVSLPDGMEYIK